MIKSLETADICQLHDVVDKISEGCVAPTVTGKTSGFLALMLGEAQLADEGQLFMYIGNSEAQVNATKNTLYTLCVESGLRVGETGNSVVTYLDSEISKRFQFISVEAARHSFGSTTIARAFVDITEQAHTTYDFDLASAVKPRLASTDDWVSA
jgi:hypothetical protein